jgi:hypothetical protein
MRFCTFSEEFIKTVCETPQGVKRWQCKFYLASTAIYRMRAGHSSLKASVNRCGEVLRTEEHVVNCTRTSGQQ